MENFFGISKRINEFYDKLDSVAKFAVIIAVASNIFWPLVSSSIFLKLLGVVILFLTLAIRIIPKFGGKSGNSGNSSKRD